METMAARNVNAVAAHVIPRNRPPLYAAIPMSSPYLLMVLVALTIIAVAIPDAMPMLRKASWERRALSVQLRLTLF